MKISLMYGWSGKLSCILRDIYFVFWILKGNINLIYISRVCWFVGIKGN